MPRLVASSINAAFLGAGRRSASPVCAALPGNGAQSAVTGAAGNFLWDSAAVLIAALSGNGAQSAVTGAAGNFLWGSATVLIAALPGN
ncbi:MAG: hypothetical protein FWC28_04570, partial [Proteobacteria bacterium]|nr:hypothetical protein [Pseudomonadota bacterium]